MNLAALALAGALLAGTLPGKPPPPEPQPSLRTILKQLPGDFARIASRDHLLTLGGAGAVALGVSHQDAAITRSAVRSQALDRATEGGSALGSGYVNVGGAFATFLVGTLAGKTDVRALGADLLEAQAVNGVLTEGIKVAVRRRRPSGGPYSFPSGHTSSTFATASVLQRRFGWKVGVPAYAFGGYVAASRLQQNQHYLSDVIFGAAIGAVAGRVIRIHTPRGRVAISAIMTGRGVALVVVPVFPR